METETSDWGALSALRRELATAVKAGLKAADTAQAPFVAVALGRQAAAADAIYEQLKAALLRAAAAGRIEVATMERQMQQIAALHRALERAVKAAQRLAPLRRNAPSGAGR